MLSFVSIYAAVILYGVFHGGGYGISIPYYFLLIDDLAVQGGISRPHQVSVGLSMETADASTVTAIIASIFDLTFDDSSRSSLLIGSPHPRRLPNLSPSLTQTFNFFVLNQICASVSLRLLVYNSVQQRENHKVS